MKWAISFKKKLELKFDKTESKNSPIVNIILPWNHENGSNASFFKKKTELKFDEA